jgi:amino acid transporter
VGLVPRAFPPATVAAEAQLVRAIGVRQLTASIINTTIGAGIFVLPATAAAGLGPAAPVAYVVCAVLMLLVSLCFAAAGSRVSLTGGLYAYIEVAFGGFVGFIGGLLFWLMALFSVASVASAFADSLGVLWTAAGTGLGRPGVLLTMFGVLVLINVRGVRPAARFVELVTAAKVIPLFVLLAGGFWFVQREYLSMSIPDPARVGETAIVLIFAFVGVEVALVPSGEIRDPARTVPRAIFLALAFTTAVYLAIQTVAQGLLGPSMSTYAAAPLAEAARRVLGTAGGLLILGGATVSMFGYVSGDMLGTPRALFAFGRDGVLPGPFARVHPRFHTPTVAIVTHAVIAGALAVSGSFVQLAILGNIAALTLYLMCVAASYELQRRDVRSGGTPFVLPGGPLVPVLAAGAIVWLLSHATAREWAIEAAALAAASAFYLIRGQGSGVRGQQSGI